MPDAEKPLVAAGKLFCFSQGEYSDYGYVGHFLALVPITKTLFEQVKDACMVRIRAGEGKSYGLPVDLDDDGAVDRAMRDMFLPELVRSGAVMDIDCEELHLGNYDERLEL